MSQSDESAPVPDFGGSAGEQAMSQGNESLSVARDARAVRRAAGAVRFAARALRFAGRAFARLLHMLHVEIEVERVADRGVQPPVSRLANPAPACATRWC
jgi:hypothetical protein